ncbi:PREDICTED: centromere protein O [Cyprinodon variegatus]|uniref:centromere protein O n=1 Tax=Cyprinodon variegatus TaxID=28743 RepID=UPI0007428B1E|nr:PREDICTED: centromere protein O [Cyprinodon variegatus]
MDVDFESSELLRLMARHSELSDLLHAHQLIGGYNAVKTRKGQGMCFTLTTVYDGVYLSSYNLEMDVKPRVRISRHNIPPFIPLDDLATKSNLQTNIRAFLDTVSQHLNAYEGRKQQLNLVKVPQFLFFVFNSTVLELKTG